MFKSIQDIHEAFEKAGIKHHTDTMGERNVLITTITTKVTTYKYAFLKSDDEGNDVAVRVINVANIPKNKLMDGYKLLNSLQQKYRFAKFVVDSDGDVHVHYDFPVAYRDIGKGAVELVVALTQVLDKAYPDLMRLQWS